MQPKLLKLGTALTVVAASLCSTTTSAAAGGYYDGYYGNAAHINHIIQSAPVTDPWKPAWKPWVGTSYYQTGDTVPYVWAPKKDWGSSSYVGQYGHSTVSYYDGHGGHALYGDPHFAKRTTIIHPVIQYDVYTDNYPDHDYGYGGDHVLHVKKYATDVRDPIFFDLGSHTLSYEAKHELDQIGEIISAYYWENPKVLILLSGFTDASGSADSNRWLAKKRNHAVKQYLIDKFGFHETRFVTRAVGEEYANASGMPYGANQRRVVVSLIGLPKDAHNHYHYEQPYHDSEMAPGPEQSMAPDQEHEMAPAPTADADPGYDKGEMPDYANDMAPDHGKPGYGKDVVMEVNRCTVPTGPYAAHYVNGKVLATRFTDIDDYGGGKLEEVCGLGY